MEKKLISVLAAIGKWGLGVNVLFSCVILWLLEAIPDISICGTGLIGLWLVVEGMFELDSILEKRSKKKKAEH
jgi:hypothetical protein